MSSFRLYFFVLCGVHLVAAFSWSSCGAKTDPIKIISLDAFSNQTKTLYVSGKAKVATNLTEPIQGKVTMQKKFFWGWTTIPCVDQIGTCTYDNVCKLSPYIGRVCPAIFTKDDLPCTCPVMEGQYTVKKFPLDLNRLPHWIEEGRYRIKLRLSQHGSEILCVLINLSF